MDLEQIYMSSPDWIKGLMVVLPFVTLYATARLFAPGKVAKAAPEPLPAPYRAVPAKPALPVLEHETEMERLDRLFFAEIERIKGER